jgi:hypothetical protein
MRDGRLSEGPACCQGANRVWVYVTKRGYSRTPLIFIFSYGRQAIPRYSVQALEALAHVRGSGSQIDSRCSSPAEHAQTPPARALTAPGRPYRTRAPLRFAARRATPPPTHCLSRRRTLAPDQILPRPPMHSCQAALAASAVSGTDRECSTPAPAPGRTRSGSTRSGSTRSIRTLQSIAGLLAGSAGAVLQTLVLHSCPYFIINFIA